ncbi:hypothetical protein MTHERMOG20_23790 [Moorella thermoacetica]|nr:hypothetical protein MTHERMOG20_23790 [Moorella thermoacetica]
MVYTFHKEVVGLSSKTFLPPLQAVTLRRKVICIMDLKKYILYQIVIQMWLVEKLMEQKGR